MPTPFVMKDAKIVVNGVDVSASCTQVAIEDTAEDVDVSTFTGAGYRQIIQGMKTAQITATFLNSYDGTASAYTVLQPLYSGGSIFSVYVQPHAGTASSTNPRGSMSAMLLSFGGIGGAIGDASSEDVTFTNASTAGLTWATSGS